MDVLTADAVGAIVVDTTVASADVSTSAAGAIDIDGRGSPMWIALTARPVDASGQITGSRGAVAHRCGMPMTCDCLDQHRRWHRSY